MKVYLAAAFSRQSEIRKVGDRLAAKGVTITSRWLDLKTGRLENAFMDVRDLRDADILVRFTDNAENTPKAMVEGKDFVPAKLISGARHFETGVAWERGIPVIVVGGKQNIFDEFPNIQHVNNVDELEELLGIV